MQKPLVSAEKAKCHRPTDRLTDIQRVKESRAGIKIS